MQNHIGGIVIFIMGLVILIAGLVVGAGLDAIVIGGLFMFAGAFAFVYHKWLKKKNNEVDKDD